MDYLGLHTIGVQEILPPVFLKGLIVVPGGYAAGWVKNPLHSLKNQYRCEECPKEKNTPIVHRADITLTLRLETEIVAKGVPHPDDNTLLRTAAGVTLTTSHEANHRLGVKTEFEKYKGYYAPVMNTIFTSWPQCKAALEPIKLKIDKEWKSYVLSEEAHVGSHWTTWFSANNPSSIW
jgi:hypothetical protein